MASTSKQGMFASVAVVAAVGLCGFAPVLTELGVSSRAILVGSLDCGGAELELDVGVLLTTKGRADLGLGQVMNGHLAQLNRILGLRIVH